MIGKTLEFVRAYLNDTLKRSLGEGLEGANPEKVVFPIFTQSTSGSLELASGAVTVLLVNLEEERILRGDNLYSRQKEDGTHGYGQPDLRLVLYLLLTATFSSYEESWNNLSILVSQLNSMRVFDHESVPSLPEEIGKLSFELVSQSFHEMNDIWNALRISIRPALLYRVHLLTIPDRNGRIIEPIQEIQHSWQEI